MSCKPGTSILILKQEWLDSILNEGKKMEIRSFYSKKIGERIGLMASKTDHVVGMATITSCVGPLSLEEFVSLEEKHKCTSKKLPYAKTFGWVLENVVTIPPVFHKRKKGAIVFSTFREELEEDEES